MPESNDIRASRESVIRLEEQMRGVERRLDMHQRAIMWLIGLIGTAALGMALAVLTRAST